MGIIFEICSCSAQKVVIPNSKSMIENDNNNIDNINLIEETKNQKIGNNGIIVFNEQNNEAETYNNISSKGAIMTPKNKKEINAINKSKEKEDEINQKDLKNKNAKGNKKKERKKSKKKVKIIIF